MKKAFGVLALAVFAAALALGDPSPDTTTSTYDRWTFVGTHRGTDEIGRDVLVVVCERRGERQWHPIKYGQDATYDDVEVGELCPTMANP